MNVLLLSYDFFRIVLWFFFVVFSKVKPVSSLLSLAEPSSPNHHHHPPPLFHLNKENIAPPSSFSSGSSRKINRYQCYRKQQPSKKLTSITNENFRRLMQCFRRIFARSSDASIIGVITKSGFDLVTSMELLLRQEDEILTKQHQHQPKSLQHQQQNSQPTPVVGELNVQSNYHYPPSSTFNKINNNDGVLFKQYLAPHRHQTLLSPELKVSLYQNISYNNSNNNSRSNNINNNNNNNNNNRRSCNNYKITNSSSSISNNYNNNNNNNSNTKNNIIGPSRPLSSFSRHQQYPPPLYHPDTDALLQSRPPPQTLPTSCSLVYLHQSQLLQTVGMETAYAAKHSYDSSISSASVSPASVYPTCNTSFDYAILSNEM